MKNILAIKILIKKHSFLEKYNYLFLILFFPSFVAGVFIANCVIGITILINLVFNSKEFITILKKNVNLSYLFLLFYILLITSSLLSNYIFFSLGSSFLYFNYLLYIFLFLIILKLYSRAEVIFLISGLITFLILSLDAIYEFSFGQNLLGFSAQDGRISSFFNDRWVIGSYLVRILPILVGIFLINYKLFKKNIRYLIYLVFILSAIVIVLSGERKAFLLLILYTFILYIYFFKCSKRLRLFFIPIIILFISIPFLFDESSKRLKFQLIHHTTNFNVFENQYYALYSTSYEMFIQNPIIGIGPNNYRKSCFDREYVQSYYSCSTHPHNTLLQTLSEIGLIGTSFVYFVFLFFIYKIFTQIKRSLQFDHHTLGFLSIKSAIVLNLWPIIPTGNFFLSWYGFIYFLPISFYFFYYKNNK